MRVAAYMCCRTHTAGRCVSTRLVHACTHARWPTAWCKHGCRRTGPLREINRKDMSLQSPSLSSRCAMSVCYTDNAQPCARGGRDDAPPSHYFMILTKFLPEIKKMFACRQSLGSARCAVPLQMSPRPPQGRTAAPPFSPWCVGAGQTSWN